MRLALTYTTSFTQSAGGSSRLPPAALLGSTTVRFPVVGSGSARVFSPPVRPRTIGGKPYIALDMGRNGRLPVVRRPGLTGLWGDSVALDPRLLTSSVRDVSLITADAYRRLQPPTAIRCLPADLANPDLEYSGIFEDGWVGESSYAVLAGGPATTLTLRALVLRPHGRQSVRILVNGHLVDSRHVKPGTIDLQLPLRRSRGRRKIELLWAGVSHLSAQDPRTAAARVIFLGYGDPESDHCPQRTS